MVYKYKTKQVQFPHQFRIREAAMHFSICTFLGLWFAAQLIWSFCQQQTLELAVDDMLWLIGYISSILTFEKQAISMTILTIAYPIQVLVEHFHLDCILFNFDTTMINSAESSHGIHFTNFRYLDN